MTFVKNLPIKMQVLLISIIALLGFLIIIGIYIANQVHISSLEEELAAVTKERELTEAIRYDFLNARRREKDFLIRLDEKYLGQHADTVSRIKANLDELSKHQQSGETASTINALWEKFQAYDTQFLKVATAWQTIGLNEKVGLRGSLRKAVHGVEEELKKEKNDGLMVTMLMMRRHEKDFIIRLADKYVGRMVKRLAEFETALKASPINSGTQSNIMQLMQTYHKDFNSLAAARLELQADIKQLSVLFAESEPLKEALVTKTQTDYIETSNSIVAAKTLAGTLMIITILAISVLALALALLIGRLISKPVTAMTDAMALLADGDKEIHIPGTEQKNEIGHMAKSLSFFRDKLIEADRLAEQQRQQQTAREERVKAVESLTQTFDDVVSESLETVTSKVSEMSTTAEAMTSTASQADQKANNVSDISQRTSSNVQTVAAATDELSSSIAEISSQVSKASSVANSAVGEARTTNAKIKGLAEAAQRIGDVLAMITEIADQTNLLALNATIEAARAGEAGKGFAVVASEVKSLAQQTAKATDEIGAQISAIQNETKDSVVAIDSIGKTIDEIDQISSGIAAAVEQQMAATKEIARNIEQASRGTEEVASNITDVSMAASETGDASQRVMSAAGEMAAQSDLLRKEIERFITDIKAA